jgi:hypothetical protein
VVVIVVVVVVAMILRIVQRWRLLYVHHITFSLYCVPHPVVLNSPARLFITDQ